MKLYNLPKETSTKGLRQLRKKEIRKIYPLLNEHLKEYKVSINMSAEEAVHYLNPRKDVVYSYVVEDPESSEITDFISFYALPSTVLGNDKHDRIKAAYLYYHFTTKTKFADLLKDAIVSRLPNIVDHCEKRGIRRAECVEHHGQRQCLRRAEIQEGRWKPILLHVQLQTPQS